MEDIYRIRRNFLTFYGGSHIEDDILCTYREYVKDNCKFVFEEFFGLKSNLYKLKCTQIGDYEWRWYLYINSITGYKIYYIDLIYGPELSNMRYDKQKHPNFLFPHVMKDTPEKVEENIDLKIRPIFNKKSYPHIVGALFYYSIPRSDDMCYKLKSILPEFCNMYVTTNEVVDPETGRKKVIYEKEYVNPFCEFCYETEYLVQVSGSGFTMCQSCFAKEIKKGEYVKPSPSFVDKKSTPPISQDFYI